MRRILVGEFDGTPLETETNPVLADGDSFYSIRPPSLVTHGRVNWLIEKFSWSGSLARYVVLHVLRSGSMLCDCPRGRQGHQCRHVDMVMEHGVELFDA